MSIGLDDARAVLPETPTVGGRRILENQGLCEGFGSFNLNVLKESKGFPFYRLDGVNLAQSFFGIKPGSCVVGCLIALYIIKLQYHNSVIKTKPCIDCYVLFVFLGLLFFRI